MRAAIDPAALLDAMTNDAALAMGASRRQRRDRAFETVERQGLSLRQDLEALVVVVAANIARRHDSILSQGGTLPTHSRRLPPEQLAQMVLRALQLPASRRRQVSARAVDIK